MDVPDLVRRTLGDEAIRTGVTLGDEDVAYFTPTRTLVYSGEGLLSDEGIAVYPHDFRRVAVSEGRRKTTFSLTYVDATEEFSVPNERAGMVLERLLEGSLEVAGVLDADESVTDVFRFSELTVVVAEGRLLKHVGEVVWDDDFESYPFEDVTKLEFERGSVATAIVLRVGDRPQRIKAPNEEAGVIRQALEEVLFSYYEVSSLEELNDLIAVEADEPTDGASQDVGHDSGGIGLDDGIAPLVDDGTSGDEETDDSRGEDRRDAPSTGVGGSSGDASDGRGDGSTGSLADVDAEAVAITDEQDRTAEQLTAVTDQLAALTEAVERQNQLLDRQQRTIKQLIDELRKSR